jgi:ML-like domain
LIIVEVSDSKVLFGNTTMPYSPYRKSTLNCWLLSVAVFLLSPVQSVKVFKSNSLSTCMKQSSFAASRFYVTFTPDNDTITFDINGYSRDTSPVVLDIEVLGYGFSVAHPIIDPCATKELAGLCPLNSGPLQIESNAHISADAVKKIPSRFSHERKMQLMGQHQSNTCPILT